MKQFISLIITITMVFSLCACGKSASSTVKEDTEKAQKTESTQTEKVEPTSEDTSPAAEQMPADKAEEVESGEPESDVKEEELIDDSAWDDLEALGKIETENGLFFVTITMPAEYVGDDITQESIDEKAGETYTSGKLNEDGSVTYKMTKKQHRAMLDSFDEAVEEAFQELIDSPDYAFTEITHNNDYTEFDVHLSTEEVGMGESIMALGFYMYGGIYAIYSGKEAENVAVHYYSASGELLETGNSSDMAE